MRRPLEVKVLVMLEVIYGVAIWGLFVYHGDGKVWWHYAMLFYPIIPYFLAYFLWNKKKWARISALGFAFFVTIGAIIYVIVARWEGYVGIIFNIPIIIFLLLPKTRSFFKIRHNSNK